MSVLMVYANFSNGKKGQRMKVCIRCMGEMEF